MRLIVAPPFTGERATQTFQAFTGAYKVVARNATGGRIVFPNVYLLDAVPGPSR
jgi:hypothetical protein